MGNYLTGAWIMINLPDWRQDFWLQHPEWEQQRIQAILAHTRRGNTVIDVGAELGDITAIIAQKIGDGQMIAIEPVARTWPVIREIFELNNLPAPICSVAFAGTEIKNNPVIYNEWPPESVGEIITEPGFQHLDERYDLPVITIDNLIEQTNTPPNIINMDIEGAELMALQGAREVLEIYKPTVFVSIHPDFLVQRYHQTKDDVLRFMELLHYKAELINIDHEEHWLFT